jgi:predicted permease
VSVITGIVFGLAPAVRTTSINLATHLKETSRNLSRSGAILTKGLIVLQVAVSLVLLIGAGLLLRTLGNLRGTEVGFNPQKILLFRLNPLLNRYDQTRAALLYDRITKELESIPGVQSVSVSQLWLLSGGEIISKINVHGEAVSNGENRAHTLLVGPRFFETMQIPFLAGRDFTRNDNRDAPKIGIINEATARKYFPGVNPIGRRIDLESDRDIEIAGLVEDAKYASVRDEAPPTVYLPFLQRQIASMNFEVRTEVDPTVLMSDVRETIRRIDPTLPVLALSTQASQLEEHLAPERFLARSYLLFGALAAILAAIGLFGVMSFNVARRTNEMGIRLALGAGRSSVMRMVLRESLALVLLGVAMGVAGALLAGRLIASLLFGVVSTDIPTFAIASCLLLLVSLLAAYLPARKASRIDPTVALRYE